MSDGGGQAGTGGHFDPQSRLPLYHQIYVLLRDRISAGQIPAGATVPGEQDLAQEFGVSRITAKRALDELAAAGLVTRERGRGTRVLPQPPSPTVTASFEGWFENMARMGAETAVRVLDFAYVPAEAEAAAALGIPRGETVQRAVRVRALADTPMSYLVTHVPAEIGRRFDREALASGPLLTLLERAGVKVASAEQIVSATLADAGVAAALDTHVGAALLEVRRIVSDTDGRPVEYIHALYRPDRYRFQMAMSRVGEAGAMRWTTGPEAADSLVSRAPGGATDRTAARTTTEVSAS
jgi:GntR family transcriptional regulator